MPSTERGTPDERPTEHGPSTARTHLVRWLRQAAFNLSGRRSAADEVRAVYRVLLGRDPEPSALAAARKHLESGIPALEPLLNAVLMSPESADHNAWRLLGGMGSLGRKAPIVSLGTHCYTSQLLKNLGLKQWSGPFDWIFSSMPMIGHCLRDDFADFLDRQHIEPVPPEARLAEGISRCEHRLFRDRYGVRHVFNHHDAHLDADHAYFVRCTDRLRSCLNQPEAKTLLACIRDYPQAGEHILQLHEALSARTTNFRLVVMRVTPPSGLPWASLEQTNFTDTLHVYRVAPSSTWEPLRFADPADDLCIARALAHSAIDRRPAEAATRAT